MANNAKKYNAYKSVRMGSEDISDYPQDTYIKPDSSQKVGKLDEYNKEKETYNLQKSKVLLKESKIPAPVQESKIDDLVPSQIGDAIDNVFSTVDNILNATGKLFFGGTKKAPKPTVRPSAQVVQAPRPVQQTQVKQNVAKQQPVPPSHTGVKPKKAKPSGVYEDIDNTPPVTRTTSISDLDLSLEILSDPDIVRYFDQMKLYDKKVPGGLCSISQRKAGEILKKGRWGKLFMISYDQLKINTMMATAEAGLQRYNGMLPVYKAMGRKFGNTDQLRKAIENDINIYLKNGEGSGEFHKFTYKIPRKNA